MSLLPNTKVRFIVGSQLYLLTNEKSDTDYVDIISDDFEKNNSDINIEEWYLSEFKEKLNNHELKALEVYFSYYDNENQYKFFDIDFELDLNKLRRIVSATCSNSHVKAKKKIAQGDIYTGLKSYWHCIRILNMMIDLAKNKTYSPSSYHDKLFDIYSDIINRINDDPSTLFINLDLEYKQYLNQLRTEFRLLCPLDQ